MFLKVYKKPFSDELVNMVDEIYQLDIFEDITSYWTADVTIPIFSGLEYGQRVEIYMTQAVYTLYTRDEIVKVYYWDDDDFWNDNNIWKEYDKEVIEEYDLSYQDVKVFEWYISRFMPKVDKIEIELTDNKGLMKKKNSLMWQEFIDTNISDILNTILDDFHTKTNELIELDMDMELDMPVTETIRVGQDFYRIIDNLVKRMWAFWTVENNKIIISDLLGIDRTSGDNFLELLYNPMNPQENNIAEISPTSYDTQANVVVGINNETSHIELDAATIEDKGALCKYFRFNDGDLIEKTQNKLNTFKNLQSLYSLTPESGIEADVWDLISVNVENTNEYVDFQGNVLVTEKHLSVDNWTLMIDLEVWETVVEKQEFTKILRDYKESFNILNTNL